MAQPTQQLIEEALKLDSDERAKLASALIASLDEGDVDDDAQEAWAAELEARAHGVLSGEVEGTDWQVVFDRVAAQLKK